MRVFIYFAGKFKSKGQQFCPILTARYKITVGVAGQTSGVIDIALT